MSAEVSSKQPPPGGGDKPKSFVSTFINKTETGKKFAPKAARRRPGAAAATNANAKTPTPAPSTPPVEQQPTQTQPSEVPAAEAAPTPQPVLPTPAATQDTTPQNAAHIEQENALPSVAVAEPPTVAPVPVVSPTATPAPTNLEDVAQPRNPSIEIDSPALLQSTASTSPVLTEPRLEQTNEDITQDELARSAKPIDTPSGITQETGIREEAGAEAQAAAQPAQSRKRRRLPWVAINQPQDDAEEVAEPSARPEPRPRPSAKARGKRKATIAPETDNEQQEDEEAEGAAGRVVLSERARGKRKATDGGSKEWTVEAPPKKPRKTRKDKGTKRNKPITIVEDGDEEEVVAADGAPRKKRKAPKRKEREPTPSDAEDQTIDPETTFMDNLASRNIRMGKLSQRERNMRQVNWAAVKQRLREEDAPLVLSLEERRRVDRVGQESGQEGEEGEAGEAGEAPTEALNQPQTKTTGPKFREVDGKIVMAQELNVVDREGDADREIELMEEVEEDDLTRRINSKSFMRNNKRFPKQFLLPGQGRRWTTEGTEQFYEALQMFGTDFMMISTMFPGTSRRSIKTKFNREERDDPARIKEALNARRNSDWQEYLTRSAIPEHVFVDPDAIEKELQAEREKKQIEIQAAKVAYEEEQRQMELAAVYLSRDENADGSAKEDGKKKKKRQPKAVVFAPEEGVEILGPDDGS